MRVSEFFSLGRSQPDLSFVDVDIAGDTPVFVDPRALRLLRDPWGDECVHLIQHFFQTVLHAIRNSQHDYAQDLLRQLREPNETRLGFSRGRARGRALGDESSIDVWEALARSQAVHSGLLEDLEDTVLMVEGIGSDIVSDIATNIIRGPLIRFTQAVCYQYGMNVEAQVDSGPLWMPSTSTWETEYVSLPVPAGHRKLVLVPKSIVRRRLDYDQDEYFREYLVPFLQATELSANTELVHLLRDGQLRVYKKDIVSKYGRGKKTIVRETRNHPEVIETYREDKRRHIGSLLTHEQFHEYAGTELPDWLSLLGTVMAVPVGTEHASEYHKAVERLLSTILYPYLANPQFEQRIHEGRKRIDIVYTNVAKDGVFYWLFSNFPASHLMVECKNYGREVGNPELDQLSGRFSPSRGKVGLLVCRSFRDKELFWRRCFDTARDERGFVMPLDDSDLEELVEQRMTGDEQWEFGFFKRRFDRLIM